LRTWPTRLVLKKNAETHAQEGTSKIGETGATARFTVANDLVSKLFQLWGGGVTALSGGRLAPEAKGGAHPGGKRGKARRVTSSEKIGAAAFFRHPEKSDRKRD